MMPKSHKFTFSLDLQELTNEFDPLHFFYQQLCRMPGEMRLAQVRGLFL